ncbi:MAG: hypothetical protein RLZZ227_830 [Pseudomonadota bacterium]|jgi:hypothetical protein
MFMNPIPIGSSPEQKTSTDAQRKDGDSDTDTSYDLVLSEDALRELQEAEERTVAINKARLAGVGMLGTLLDIKV